MKWGVRKRAEGCNPPPPPPFILFEKLALLAFRKFPIRGKAKLFARIADAGGLLGGWKRLRV